MPTPFKTINRIRWFTRMLAIAFAGFVSIFAFDVFSEGYNLRDTIGALLIHLIPSLLIVLVLILSWRREWIGGISFLLMGLDYIITVDNRLTFAGYGPVAIPIFLLSALYFIAWYQRKEFRVMS